MCLYKKPGPPKTAEEDITCYKVVEVDRNGRFTSYYQSAHIELGAMMVPNEEVDIAELSAEERLTWGVIHAFKNSSFDRSLVHHWIVWSTEGRDLAVLECVIPKGTLYFESDIDDPFCSITQGENKEPQYAALKILPVKVVKNYRITLD